MKKSLGFALGMLLSLCTVTAASAAGTSAAAPAQLPGAGIEVIVVTAKRPAVQPVHAAQPIAEVIVIGKRAPAAVRRTPPAMPIEMPKLDLAVSALPAVRL